MAAVVAAPEMEAAIVASREVEPHRAAAASPASECVGGEDNNKGDASSALDPGRQPDEEKEKQASTSLSDPKFMALVEKLSLQSDKGSLNVAAQIILALKDLREDAQLTLLDCDRSPPETLLREKLEKSHQEAILLAKVRTIEHTTAQLKLANAKEKVVSMTEEECRREGCVAWVESVVELAEITKKNAEKAIRLRNDISDSLCKARTREVEKYKSYQLAAIAYRRNVDLVKTFQSPLVENPDRSTYYYSNCRRPYGMGKFLFPILAQRADWREMPSKFWFKLEKGENPDMYCPVGHMMVDYADVSRFSMVDNTIEGSVWIDNKAHIYNICPSYLPRTYVVRDGKWDTTYGTPHSNESPGVWFLKEVDTNYATGVETFADPAACLANAKKDKMYVVQPHLQDPLLWDKRSVELFGSGIVGAKFHIRAYTLAYSPPKGRTLRFFSHPHGYISVGDVAWTPHNEVNLGCQVTRDRSHRWQDWHRYDETYSPTIKVLMRVFGMLAPKLDPVEKKGCFQLFGSDFVFDRAMRPWLIEVNAGPCVKEADEPMLHKMMEIVVPTGLKERSDIAPEWELMFECEASPKENNKSEEKTLIAVEQKPTQEVEKVLT